MITVHFIDHHGQSRAVATPTGTSLMRAATEHGIAGILAECGGAGACATCVCDVDADWVPRLAPADAMELAMLDDALDSRPNSRLACQIPLTAALDGLVVRVPRSG